jgi:membrane protein implicated in regulation of membrane protease activity
MTPIIFWVLVAVFIIATITVIVFGLKSIEKRLRDRDDKNNSTKIIPDTKKENIFHSTHR